MKYEIGDMVEPNKKFLDSKHRPFGYFVAEVIDIHNDAKPPLVQMRHALNGTEFWQTIEYIQPHIHSSPCHCHHHCSCCCSPVDDPMRKYLLDRLNLPIPEKQYYRAFFETGEIPNQIARCTMDNVGSTSWKLARKQLLKRLKRDRKHNGQEFNRVSKLKEPKQ